MNKAIKRVKWTGLSLAVGVLVGLSVYVSWFQPAQAQIITPTVGDKYLDPNSAPCLPFNIGPATGTRAVEVRASGPGYISWVMLSTVTNSGGQYLTLFDTNTATGLVAGQYMTAGGTRVVSEIGGIIPYASSSTAANTAYNATANVFSFQPPALFLTGVTARSTCSNCWATVCTRLYGTQVP